MPRITLGMENNAPIEIHYEDHGSGKPIVMVHGYPLDGNSWERQERVLLAGARLPALLDEVKLVAIEGGPHDIAWTHPDEVNLALLEFVDAPAVTGRAR
ncbi:hypothetical protein Aph01nite_16010 [Acrocarpospora phusangensis]|uniref:AB hydrolase-1 domain-containing protein n=1 Tax=Acrocarpospora phusangensis TaxID=1070424 RepID=A0A919Q6Y1_9ACTN|nr:hypothetical protein [Acrocarpospora phusangensis]GIH23291.1 hypothetical protein Aph01nite_16010 [Acrocarpospora phusangensis]